MTYVTYYDTFLDGLSDVKFHKNKDEAVKFYRTAAHCYFDNLSLPTKITPPTACGFPHRMFAVVSIKQFNSEFPEFRNPKKGTVK